MSPPPRVYITQNMYSVAVHMRGGTALPACSAWLAGARPQRMRWCWRRARWRPWRRCSSSCSRGCHPGRSCTTSACGHVVRMLGRPAAVQHLACNIMCAVRLCSSCLSTAYSAGLEALHIALDIPKAACKSQLELLLPPCACPPALYGGSACLTSCLKAMLSLGVWDANVWPESLEVGFICVSPWFPSMRAGAHVSGCWRWRWGAAQRADRNAAGPAPRAHAALGRRHRRAWPPAGQPVPRRAPGGVPLPCCLAHSGPLCSDPSAVFALRPCTLATLPWKASMWADQGVCYRLFGMARQQQAA